MLKEWLSLLLSKFYSKKESDLVARQAMPQENSSVTLLSGKTQTDWEKILDYVAPADGYINVRANKQSTAGGSDISVCVGELFTVAGSVTEAQRSIHTPIRKGATATIYAAGVRSLSILFIRSVGGGFLALFKGVQYA